HCPPGSLGSETTPPDASSRAWSHCVSSRPSARARGDALAALPVSTATTASAAMTILPLMSPSSVAFAALFPEAASEKRRRLRGLGPDRREHTLLAALEQHVEEPLAADEPGPARQDLVQPRRGNAALAGRSEQRGDGRANAAARLELPRRVEPVGGARRADG